MSTQAPMASDLRILLATLSIVTELERMADHAAGNAKVAIMIGDESPLKPLIDLPRMNEIVIDMLHQSLDAFIHHDAEAARKIVSRDDEIDHLYDQVFRELLIFMMEDPRTITRAERLTRSEEHTSRERV
ncbi:MAG: phosphate transport system regulatory protein PhoU, partial [Chloroflexi bacterium]|nr:phosphate transport system regulatory protein PhoU [Chloroflexota bacterium]